MYSLIQLLKNIGLSEKEALTYLTNLKFGTNPASVIAKHTELNRCTTYSILDSLIKKGLVYQFEKNKIRYFTAIEPKELLNYVDEMKHDLSFYKNKISNFIPEFEALKHPYQIIPTIKTYSGKSGITKIFHEVIKEPRLSIWAIESKNKNHFFTRFMPTLIKNNKLVRLIINSKYNSEKINVTSLQEIENIKPCSPIEFIGDKKTILLSPSVKQGIEIVNSEIVKLSQDKFNTVWKT